MHMADALLSPAVGGAMWVVTGAAVAVSSRAMTRSMDTSRVPLMGVMGAFVFAAQMINFTIPGTGSSGHFAGGLLLAMLLGPHAAFLTMASVLTVQALIFADGGLLALGANIFNMGFVSCFLVYPLLTAPLAGAPGTMRYRAVIWISAVAALQIGALGVVVETTASGIAELPFSAFVLAMLPIHLAIGIGEGVITLAVVEFLRRAEPGIFAPAPAGGVRQGVVVMATLALVVGGVLSWFASTHPDGLEWSLERMTGKPEVTASTDSAHQLAAHIQSSTALLPDYSFPAEKKGGAAESEGEGDSWGTPNAGTSVSGLAGGLMTLVLAGLAGWLFRRRQPLDGATR